MKEKLIFKHFHDHSSVTTANPICTVYKKEIFSSHFANSAWDWRPRWISPANALAWKKITNIQELQLG